MSQWRSAPCWLASVGDVLHHKSSGIIRWGIGREDRSRNAAQGCFRIGSMQRDLFLSLKLWGPLDLPCSGFDLLILIMSPLCIFLRVDIFLQNQQFLMQNSWRPNIAPLQTPMEHPPGISLHGILQQNPQFQGNKPGLQNPSLQGNQVNLPPFPVQSADLRPHGMASPIKDLFQQGPASTSGELTWDLCCQQSACGTSIKQAEEIV